MTLALSSAQPSLGEFFFWLYELSPRAQLKLNSRGLDTWLGLGAGADGRPPVEGVAVNQLPPSSPCAAHSPPPACLRVHSPGSLLGPHGMHSGGSGPGHITEKGTT